MISQVAIEGMFEVSDADCQSLITGLQPPGNHQL